MGLHVNYLDHVKIHVPPRDACINCPGPDHNDTATDTTLSSLLDKAVEAESCLPRDSAEDQAEDSGLAGVTGSPYC